jgi:hypothetical protein
MSVLFLGLACFSAVGVLAAAVSLLLRRRSPDNGGEPFRSELPTNDLDREISEQHLRSRSFWP